MNLLDLTGKRILITGGCGAIGLVVVRVLTAHGATLIVNDILPDSEANQRLDDAGIAAEKRHYIRADNTDPADVERMFQASETAVGLPDVVCCHAGLAQAHPIQEYPLETYDRLFNVNTRAAFIVAQAATQRWLAQDQPGLLLFTTSWVQNVPWPEIAPYNASKAAMRMLMRNFARELAPKIRANAIAPGIVGVGMAKHQWDTEPQYRARAQKAIPLGEMQSPEDVAYAFLFLCSPMAAYMTGSVLLVDGGCSLYPMDE